MTWTPFGEGEGEDLDWGVLTAKKLGGGLVAHIFGTIEVSGDVWG